jgi:hypothetical protein
MAIPNSGDDLIAAIYDVIIEPSGWDEVVNRIIEATKSLSGGLNMGETNAAHRVELAEWQLLEILAPHLQRAAAIHDLLGRVRAVTNSLGAATAAAGFAVFLLTGDCRVLFANSILPLAWRAKSQLNSAVRAPPICRKPVGDGAKRVSTESGMGAVSRFEMAVTG